MSEQVAHAVAAAPPRLFQGAVSCCKHAGGDFFDGLQGYVQRNAPKLRSLSFHRYPTSRCNGSDPDLSTLLQPHASSGQAQVLVPLAEWCRDAGVPLVVGEANSVACGGTANVSDVLGAALWAADALLELARINATAVNFHGGPQGPYAPVAFHPSAPSAPLVRPLYYGMLLAAEATANAARFLDAAVTTTDPTNLAVHALLDGSTGSTRLVIIHKDLAQAAATPMPVTVQLPAQHRLQAAPPVATLVRLHAPSSGVFATSGISYAGLSFDGSPDGLPVTPRSYEPVSAQPGGIYAFQIWPLTAVVLEVPA